MSWVHETRPNVYKSQRPEASFAREDQEKILAVLAGAAGVSRKDLFSLVPIPKGRLIRELKTLTDIGVVETDFGDPVKYRINTRRDEKKPT